VVQSLIALSAVLALWALLAQPMQRGRITAPILLVLAGVAIEYGTYHAGNWNSSTMSRCC
jgi:sodium/hydrogen antiporter